MRQGEQAANGKNETGAAQAICKKESVLEVMAVSAGSQTGNSQQRAQIVAGAMVAAGKVHVASLWLWKRRSLMRPNKSLAAM